jgi:MFS family permease
VATALSPGLFLFVVFRIVVGVAVGASSMIVPTYIAELAPGEIRGGLVILQQLAISGGIFLSYVLDYVFFTTGAGCGRCSPPPSFPGSRSRSAWSACPTRRAGWPCRAAGSPGARARGYSPPARW